MTADDARAKLEALDARVQKLSLKWRNAKYAADHAWETARDVAQEAADYYAGLQFRRSKHHPEDEYNITARLLKAIDDRGLRLVPLDPKRPAAGLRVVDPRPAVALKEAERALNRACRLRNEFAAKHTDLLAHDEAKRAVDRVNDALHGDDPHALREALESLPQKPARPPENTLTTADLPTVTVA